jgi:hypothetical protein
MGNLMTRTQAENLAFEIGTMLRVPYRTTITDRPVYQTETSSWPAHSWVAIWGGDFLIQIINNTEEWERYLSFVSMLQGMVNHAE